MACMSLLPARSVDKRLIRAAARYDSPEEMSEFVNRQLSPAECKARVDELLTSKSEFDEVQERRLLLIQMAEHLDWLKDMRHNEKAWPQISRMMKVISDQIERTNINLADINMKLAQKYAEIFVTAYTIGFEKALKAIAETTGHDDILEVEVMEEVARIGIEASQEYLHKVTVRDDAE